MYRVRREKKKGVKASPVFKVNRQDVRGNCPLHRILLKANCKLGVVRYFLNLGADVNIQNKRGRTPLYVAVLNHCSLDVITLLLKSGARPNRTDHKDVAPLQLTVYDVEQFDVMKLLLRHRADVNLQNKKMFSVLHYAIMLPIDHKRAVIELLVEYGANLNLISGNNISPFELALHYYEKKNRNVFKLLLNNGADLNILDVRGYSLLHIACECGCKPHIVKLLLDRGIKVNLTDRDGNSALSVAVQRERGNVDGIRLLLTGGALTNITNNYNRSPLYFATIFRCQMDVIELFLNYGSHINERDTSGVTPLHCAVNNKKSTLKVIEFLINQGANVREADNFGNNSLHFAVSSTNRKKLSIIQLLLKNGADAKAVNKERTSPLEKLMIFSPNLDVAKLLLDSGAYINARDINGVTPLHCAVNNKKSTLKVIEFLINQGANVRAADNSGNNPLHFAVSSTNRKKLSIIKLLLKSGADVEAVNMHKTSPLKTLMIFSPKRDVVKLLLDYGAQIDLPTNESRAEVLEQLFNSCEKDKNRLNCVKLMIKYAFLQDNFSHKQIIEGCKRHIVLSSFANECLLEVAQMQSVKVGNLTVYEFLKTFRGEM